MVDCDVYYQHIVETKRKELNVQKFFFFLHMKGQWHTTIYHTKKYNVRKLIDHRISNEM